MIRFFNRCGDYCYRSFGVCDHNRIDSPDKQFVCSGLTRSECIEGSEYEFYDKEVDSNGKVIAEYVNGRRIS